MQVQENVIDPLFDRKVDLITAGLPAGYAKCLKTEVSWDNALIISSYIVSMKTEINLSDNYRRLNIILLAKFSKFFNNEKSFNQMTRDDVLQYLDSLRKPEVSDPLHKWVGTYNLYRIQFIRFFKWLYSPDIEPSKRLKPKVIENIPKLKRKEQSIYKPSDLWTVQDDLLFLEYCPSKRDKCYHSMSRDLSCRPHEILKLKIKDIAFKTVNAYQYVDVVVNGKTGTRFIPLINSIPYVKDYLDHEHAQPSNPNAPLICGMGRSLGRHILPVSLCKIYSDYKKIIFPKLLESPNVLPEDKQRIKELLKKPWNPYIRRHSALTEKSMILKEHVLRQHAGWSPGSQMHLKYLHYFGNESSESLLEAYGIIAKGHRQKDQLRPKQCPNCSEPNKPDSKFCAKCRMVLTYDTYNQTLVNQKEKEDELQTMKKQFRNMQSQLQTLITTLGSIRDQTQINQTAKILYESGILNSSS